MDLSLIIGYDRIQRVFMWLQEESVQTIGNNLYVFYTSTVVGGQQHRCHWQKMEKLRQKTVGVPRRLESEDSRTVDQRYGLLQDCRSYYRCDSEM